MIDGFLIIILVMLGCIGLGVLIGWSIWGSDAKYYKNLAEAYKKKLTSTDIDVKEVILRYLKNRKIEIKRDKLDSLHSPEMKKRIIEIGKKYDPKNSKKVE